MDGWYMAFRNTVSHGVIAIDELNTWFVDYGRQMLSQLYFGVTVVAGKLEA